MPKWFPAYEGVFDGAATVLILGLVAAMSLYIFVRMLAGAKQEIAAKKAQVCGRRVRLTRIFWRGDYIMAKRLSLLTLLAILPWPWLFGCGEMGKVDQGRVIAFDKTKETVTFIVDVKHDPANPDYSGAPVTFALPKDPTERGEDPKSGKRMKLDTKAREIIIYDPGHPRLQEDHLYPDRSERRRGQGQPPGGRARSSPWWTRPRKPSPSIPAGKRS